MFPIPPGSRARARLAGPALRTTERGFTLLVLIGILTAVLIAVGAALPLWRGIAQRDREAELVARGFQYAEAIRVFQKRQSRLPTQLKELVEVEPRSIRKLWDDPMTGGPFLVLLEGPGGTVVPVDPVTGQVVAPPAAETPEGEEGEGPAAAPPQLRSQADANGGPIAGPIHGVKSRASGEAYRVLFDQKDYGNWEFTVERLVAATSATGPDGILRRLDYTTIGKAFPYAPPGGVAGGNPQPLAGGRPRRPGEPPPGQKPPLQPMPEDSDDEQPDDGSNDG